MADPVSASLAWWQRYGPIVAGLILGTLAKYGLTLNEGRRLSWRGVLADLLLLGMLGLIAIAMADWLNLTGNNRVLAGALAAVSSDRLVRLARDRFLKRAGEELAQAIQTGPSLAAYVPRGNGEPESVTLMPTTPDNPSARAGASLKAAHRRTLHERPPADQIEALRRLDP